MTLSARNVSWNAGGQVIVRDISLDVRTGEFLGIVGPNGSGKTSLMMMLSGIRKPKTGEIFVDGTPIRSLGRRELSRRLALVEQQADTGERITARQAVELGRTPYLGALSPWSATDDAIVEAALVNVDMLHLSGRLWHTLSGGERQRLHIGRALAQQPKILLLDEPTNHLDIGHQIGLLDLVRRQDLTVVAALHDLNHAAMFCDRLAVMNDGRLVAFGTPREVLTAECIRDVFGVEVEVEHDSDGGCFIRYRASAVPRRPLRVIDEAQLKSAKVRAS
ncbi:ABC transporter ATP-binding protein [Agrobacterium rhizogenes]|uniref:ABC transporter ATP-binding protein n=1 Tax=Rhizobium rhizogenes TaxID=359 RepID=UPI000645FA32|nr:ABC transporter ATP-binding protein [Rhizobium rhizogenes]NTG76916.1 ABC transporter ATP-binding protein [Rhizobium rhizogenes]NTH15546.1 ABC transporter ATP-binding protein [Rhizobium rhizogenes]NTI77300.1 ABC transporter ATP-binding protein [Rhizobium rhizogenes]